MSVYLLGLEQSATQSCAVLFDHVGQTIAKAQQPCLPRRPQRGLVEYDAVAIWDSQREALAQLLAKSGVSARDIVAVGISNQRATTVVWERDSGKPICPAISWQDTRSAEACELWKKSYNAKIRCKTGLEVSTNYSASKLRWILDNIPRARVRAKSGDLCFGTIDSWLMWQFSKGKLHITDASNAARTMLFDICDLCWDEELLKLFDIPLSMLPQVHSSSEVYGKIAAGLPGAGISLAASVGDKQAALLGQMCIDSAMVKSSYDYGCNLLMNVGSNLIFSEKRLISTVAWQIDGKATYALEGRILSGEITTQWLREGLKIIKTNQSLNNLAATVENSGGVFFLPALQGLGAPYDELFTRGAIFGINHNISDAHIARAALESVAFQSYDVIKTMEADIGRQVREFRVGNDANVNNILMQIQADLFGFDVVQSKVADDSALGAAYLAGLAVAYFYSLEDIADLWTPQRVFFPLKTNEEAEMMIASWHKALRILKDWLN